MKIATAKPSEKPPLSAEDCKRVAIAIAKISDAAKAMRNAGLSQKALIILLQASTGLTQSQIKLVLIEQERLASWCLS